MDPSIVINCVLGSHVYLTCIFIKAYGGDFVVVYSLLVANSQAVASPSVHPPLGFWRPLAVIIHMKTKGIGGESRRGSLEPPPRPLFLNIL